MAGVSLLNNNLSSTENEYDELETQWQSLEKHEKSCGKNKFNRKALACCLLSPIVVIVTSVATLLTQAWLFQSSASTCIRTVAATSPITRDLNIEFGWQRFNGSFLNENIYRQAASPEVDAAWQALGAKYGPIRISTDAGREAGLGLDKAQVNEKYGGGYVVLVEGFHHLHCLNLLRQTLYYNIDYYRNSEELPFADSEATLRKHTSHCLDILRQQLMCTVDIGVFGEVWYQRPNMEQASQFPDFNTWHMCRNFEAVREWTKDRQLPKQVPGDFLVQPSSDSDILDAVP